MVPLLMFKTVRQLWILLVFLSSGLLAQVEICDNGVDDNGNGLIDLNDPFCTCTGISFSGDLTQLIPNPSFEDMDCCPENFSFMHCLTGWENGNSGTSDYMHACGFIMSGVLDANLAPFPNGQGITGGVYTLNYKEYISTCLNEPFQAGSQYTLSFRTAFVSVFTNGQTCVPPAPFDPAPITLFGHPTCDNLTVGGSQCPSSADPNWVVLGQVVIPPLGQWMEVQIIFTPGIDISAIMLGPACALPSNYTADCQPYVVYDDLTLYGDLLYDKAEIFTLGLLCDEDFSLLADVNYQGPGQWQWYYNGVALPGQTDPGFPVSANNYQSGTYQVTFSTPDGCIQDSIAITIPSRDTVEVNASFCPGGSVGCGGQQFSAPGMYEITLQGYLGCDSLVVCMIEELETSSATEIEIDTCGPFTINVCGNELSGYGSFEITCVDSRGCDSIVLLELRVLEPESYITPPGVLACDPEAFVLLDGSLSPLNPIPGGTTSYEWSGPPGGIDGDPFSPVVEVILPGVYCLTVIFEYNGVECSSTACVTVSAAAAIPSPPAVQGPLGGCVGDTLLYSIRATGSVAATAYEWFIPPGVEVELLTDSTLLLPLIGPGTVRLCARTLNECGATDSVCVQVTISGVDTLFLAGMTCDSTEAGTFQDDFQNQFGCDSIVIRQITLAPSYLLLEVNTTCDPAGVGADTFLLTTSQGCDSIVIRQTDLLPSHIVNQIFFTCDQAEAGLDTLFLQNQHGCDSTVYIERIYTGRYEEFNQIQICGNGTAYSDTLLVTSGPCDSLFITNYQYVSLDTTLLNASTCDPAEVGIVVQVLPGFSGCDSTIITQTLLLPSDTQSVEAFTCDPAGAGVEVVNLLNQYGCDSVVTISTLYVEVDTQYQFLTTCDPQQSGVEVVILPGALCDTVRIITTTWIPSSESRDTLDLCGPALISMDTLFLQNAAGCDSLLIRITRYHELVPEWLVRNEGCAGRNDGAITITRVEGGTPPVEYRLDQGPWRPSADFKDLPPGSYAVFLRDANGCEDTLSSLVVGAGVDLTLDAGPDRIASEGAFVNLEVQSSHPLVQITWQAVDPLDCVGCPTPRLGPVTGDQTVRVTGVAAEGCVASDDLLVLMIIPPKVYIPSTFSPNADGINDIFSVYANLQVRSVRNLAIYDRWGNGLYARADLPVNDPNAGWDGYYRGKLMDPGVYVYVIEVELIDGSTRIYKGDVTLVR